MKTSRIIGTDSALAAALLLSGTAAVAQSTEIRSEYVKYDILVVR
jgi:hypothetical protein